MDEYVFWINVLGWCEWREPGCVSVLVLLPFNDLFLYKSIFSGTRSLSELKLDFIMRQKVEYITRQNKNESFSWGSYRLSWLKRMEKKAKTHQTSPPPLCPPRSPLSRATGIDPCTVCVVPGCEVSPEAVWCEVCIYVTCCKWHFFDKTTRRITTISARRGTNSPPTESTVTTARVGQHHHSINMWWHVQWMQL